MMSEPASEPKSEPTPQPQETLYSPAATRAVPAVTDESALPVPSESAPYDPGPLFSKKVLIGWALAALTVWFAFTFIGPIVKEAVKSAIVSSLEEAGSNTAVKTVITTKNGLTITRSEKGVTIERNSPPGPTPPATAKPEPATMPVQPATVPSAANPRR